MGELVACEKCGMSYFPDDTEDLADHARRCDQVVNGTIVPTSSVNAAIWRNKDDQIILVTDKSSEEQRKLAHEIARCANREMQYDYGIYRYYDSPDGRNVHIFLYVRSGRARGFCLLEKRTTVWHCTWNEPETPTCIERQDLSPMWSVGFVWVHKEQRHRGVAYSLLAEAKTYLGLNDGNLGWHTPFSEDGKRLVRRLYPSTFNVAE